MQLSTLETKIFGCSVQCFIQTGLSCIFLIIIFTKTSPPPVFQNFIQNHRGEFDVIVSEITFCGHIHAALAHKYNASLVNFHPMGYASSQFSLLGALAPPGSTVDIRLPYTDLHQTLWQRANTFYIYLCDLWDVYSYYLPKMEKLMVEGKCVIW